VQADKLVDDGAPFNGRPQLEEDLQELLQSMQSTEAAEEGTSVRSTEDQNSKVCFMPEHMIWC
jgi:hypothetical protein